MDEASDLVLGVEIILQKLPGGIWLYQDSSGEEKSL